jgi:antitoxin MazE
MHSALRKIGNSTGIVLPKPVLAQIGLASGATLDLTVEDGRLIGTPIERPVRAGWAEAAAVIAASGEAPLPDWGDFGNEGDIELAW